MLSVTDPMLTRVTPRLAEVPGIVGVVLGGSGARGTAHPTSDYDIGLYYGPDEPLDTEYLLNVARDFVGDASAAAVTPVGGWGPPLSVADGCRSKAAKSMFCVAAAVKAIVQSLCIGHFAPVCRRPRPSQVARGPTLCSLDSDSVG
jgi:hypothetical protein